jgi:hypothetical protein
VECHAPNGRLAGLDGIYLPGAGANALLDKLGWGLALLTLLGMLGHGVVRFLSRGKTQGETK